MSGSQKTIPTDEPYIAIVGAGIIGLACARELARRGARVCLFDRNQPGRGASWAAAGMLAPAFEAAHEPGSHVDLFEFCMQGAEVWAAFSADLEYETGQGIGYVPGPSLAIATTDEEASRLSAIAEQLAGTNLVFSVLSPAEAQAVAPEIGPSVISALQLSSDGHVDNRRVVEVLLQSCKASGRVEIMPDKLINAPAELLDQFDNVVLTAGWQTAELVPEAAHIQPVAGQMLSLERTRSSPNFTIRCGSVYIAPKQDRVIIGATMEPGVVRTQTDADSIARLRAKAETMCPGLAGARILETWAGVRPGTPDNAPMIGPTSMPNIHVAAGHFRNGILLAPITAKIVADSVLEEKRSRLARAFSPDRFRCATV